MSAYAFSFSGNLAHCREGYVDAAALIAHRENVAAISGEALKMSKIVRFEVHAPASEIEKVRESIGSRAQYFVLDDGFRRQLVRSVEHAAKASS
ncbi:MAG: hypothetical protein QM831_22320 [Kofleriaceae bacterium]